MANLNPVVLTLTDELIPEEVLFAMFEKHRNKGEIEGVAEDVPFLIKSVVPMTMIEQKVVILTRLYALLEKEIFRTMARRVGPAYSKWMLERSKEQLALTQWEMCG